MPRRSKKKAPEGFDSKFEHTVKQHYPALNRDCFPLAYTVPAKERKYQPDFQIGEIYVECKGRFRSKEEWSKYLHIRESLPEPFQLVFIFQNPSVPMPGAKLRKDGTRQSHTQWAKKYQFKHYTVETFIELVGENNYVKVKSGDALSDKLVRQKRGTPKGVRSRASRGTNKK